MVQLCFLRQFKSSIQKSDYLALRLGFVNVGILSFIDTFSCMLLYGFFAKADKSITIIIVIWFDVYVPFIIILDNSAWQISTA
jgi:hypothetical protein